MQCLHLERVPKPSLNDVHGVGDDRGGSRPTRHTPLTILQCAVAMLRYEATHGHKTASALHLLPRGGSSCGCLDHDRGHHRPETSGDVAATASERRGWDRIHSPGRARRAAHRRACLKVRQTRAHQSEGCAGTSKAACQNPPRLAPSYVRGVRPPPEAIYPQLESIRSPGPAVQAPPPPLSAATAGGSPSGHTIQRSPRISMLHRFPGLDEKPPG